MMINVLTYVAAVTMTLLQGAQTVTDGDTIRIGETRIRLEGIDAPEMSQTCKRPDGSIWRCGQQAKIALMQKIGAQPVRCKISGTDRYKRSLGTCYVGKLNLNQWMVRSGWAVSYRRYSKAYVADEQMARAQKLNIWSGEFQVPDEFRARKRHRQ
ncbi:thermonuclease family protein [Novosphingobium sp. AAP83]|uniref:thermonuclease family protein n=1 Tax=Novosphingobium sp. AAP83 TaxID=1523425 RepID=UPI0006B9CA0D|nr:thermonuclease family protein [Novosphingobium sp. AAP83]